MNIDLSKEYVLNFPNGIVVAPRFQFNENGYVSNYLNLDFYKWDKVGKEIHFYNPKNIKTAFLVETDENRWEGKWLINDSDIILKPYTKYNISQNPKGYLKNTRWRFRNNEGNIISSNLWLCEDGYIRGYQHENEFRWDLDETGLNFYSVNGEITTSFGDLHDYGDRRFFKGTFIPNRNHSHTLEYLSGENADFLNELHSTCVLSNNSDVLIVSFNGAGTPYDGKDTRWEFFHQPYKLATDFIRFSELSPISWYLNKTETILSLLESIVAKYKKVIFIGASAGGFASLIFSEILSRKFPTTQFFSYVINPQTTLTVEDRHYIVESYDEPIRPVLVTDFVFNSKDTEITDVNTLLSEGSIMNVKHNIFYDSMNPCEIFYVNRLLSDRVIKHGVPINGGHGDSGIKIFEMQLLQVALQTEILSP